MSNRIWLMVAAILAASLALSCSSPGTSTEVGDAAEAFYRALASDPPHAYTTLAADCQQEVSFLEFATDAGTFGAVLGESQPSVENVRVLRGNDEEIEAQFDIVVHVNGDTLSIVAADDFGPTTFHNEGGEWRFASCDDFSAGVRSPNSVDEVIEEARPTPTHLELAVAAEADDSVSLPGEYVDLPSIYQGHYGNDGPNTAAHSGFDVDYIGDGNSNPPAGGPHWGRGACGQTAAESPPLCGPVPWGVFRTEWDPESLVHNMEHGGVIIWYNTVDREVVDQLETLVINRLREDLLLVMAPYLDMEDEMVALTSWSRIDKFPISEYSAERVIVFLDAHVRRFNPEGF